MERHYIQLYIIFKEVKDRLSELEIEGKDEQKITKLKIIYCEIDNLIKRNRK